MGNFMRYKLKRYKRYLFIIIILLLMFSSAAAQNHNNIYNIPSGLEENILQQRSNKVLVQYKETGRDNALAGDLELKSSIRIEEIMKGIDSLQAEDEKAKEALIEKLRKKENVLHVEENKELTLHGNIPDDPGYHLQWGLHNIMAKEAWQLIDKQKKEIVVAVIDSGIDQNHEDLQKRIKPGGYNFLLNNHDITDHDGHGTVISGIIAAETSNAQGIAGVAGSLDVKILPLKTASAAGTSYVSDVIKAIDYAIDKEVDVINISMGSSSYSMIEKAAVQRAIDEGIVVVASAGNSGSSSYIYPASYENVISAGSIGKENVVSDFSHYNSRITITAPGEKIYSTSINNRYTYNNGTSFSAAFVSGAAAVIKAVDPLLEAADIKELIGATAVDMGTPGRNYSYGFGRINLKSLVKEITWTEPVAGITLSKDSLSLQAGQEYELKASVHPEKAENKKVFWTSDNPDAVSVSPKGVIKALEPGKATIIVITQEGGFTAKIEYWHQHARFMKGNQMIPEQQLIR